MTKLNFEFSISHKPKTTFLISRWTEFLSIWVWIFCQKETNSVQSQKKCYTGDLHIRWSTSCPPVDHRMSHPHASGNVPEVVHRMCRIRWTTGCAASGGPLDVCMRWTTGCVHAVVCTWWKSDGQPDVSIEWLAFGVLCSLSLFMGK